MWSLGPIGFTSPLLLWALALLPVIVYLLRAVPPAPIRRKFPGIVLLLGLRDKESQTDTTPWWLVLLRLLAVAAVIIGFAGPLLNPRDQSVSTSERLLIVMDASWGAAQDWDNTKAMAEAILDQAARDEALTALVSLTYSSTEPTFVSPQVNSALLDSIGPQAWEPQEDDYLALAASLPLEPFDTIWLSDGLERSGREALLDALRSKGRVSVATPALPILALRPAELRDGTISVTALRSADVSTEARIRALGLDPAGIERVLEEQPLSFEAGTFTATAAFDLPPELRNRLTRFDITNFASAGAVSLTGDALRRREVALVDTGASQEGLELLSPFHYLREALAPSADILSGPLDQLLLANPDVIALADVAALPPIQTAELATWVENGGLLLRFAGPNLAIADRLRDEANALLPVELRTGGRTLGGAMSWGEPKALAPFKEDSPFFGLTLPEDVSVSTQVLAQPSPELAGRVIAELSDGTPLVTRKTLGLGQVVLFHVTANAEWSSLPLSGLFVQMLERLALASGNRAQLIQDLETSTWSPTQIMDGFGAMTAVDTLESVDGATIASGQIGAELPPGIYQANEQTIALNAVSENRILEAATWPSDVIRIGQEASETKDLKGALLTAALVLALIDIIAALGLTGRLRVAQILVFSLGIGVLSHGAQAQDDRFALEATENVVLAYVLTGDDALDAGAKAGLLGLSQALFRRTSVEPAAPMGVNLETDEIALFPFLYWPISPDQPIPSQEAYAKLNLYLQRGGLILFDTRDADRAGFGGGTPEGQKLRRIAIGLDIPPLEPIPQDHVLSRTFYLLQAYPGRFDSLDIWVEAAQANAEQIEGLPFRILNDGVTPVVIGGNDWASAWAVDEIGNRLYPVGRGMAGEQQREYAYRFGINLIMHVLTGNYKSDQVHVPALLDRLGQ